MPTPLPGRDKARKMAEFHATGEATVGSGGEPVLVEQPAGTVKSLDDAPSFELRQGQVGDPRFEVVATVRALALLWATNSRNTRSAWRSLGMSTQSRHSVRAVRTNLSAKAFGLGARKGVLMARAPTDLITSSKDITNLPSRSRIREAERSSR
jgi:hypothetical protein